MRFDGECERKLAEHINATHLCCKPCTFFFMNFPMYELVVFRAVGYGPAAAAPPVGAAGAWILHYPLRCTLHYRGAEACGDVDGEEGDLVVLGAEDGGL